MRAHQHAAPLVVVRSEAESGRVGLRLIGELDLNTVALLETELARSREQAPPAVIDLSELRFLDLIGLRALLRAGQAGATPPTRLVGATGIVRRLIDLTRAMDAETTGGFGRPSPDEPATRVTGEGVSERAREFGDVPANGNGNGNGNGKKSPSNGNNRANRNGDRRAAPTRDGDVT
jgi:anti-anti-sigma factor